jgi:hypothetical protein
MRTGVAALLLTMVVCCGVSVAQLDDPAVAKQKYDTYKARVTGGDLSMDWRAFRLAAITAGVDGGFDWRAARARVLSDLDAGKNEQALAGANRIVDHNIASPEGHLLAMMALGKMGRTDEAKRERAIVDAIVKSILDSGDGRSAKTAWFTVDPAEEYFLMGAVLGMRPKGQALVREGGHAFDKMTVLDQEGAEHELWFNTDTDVQVMEAGLHAKKK